jgi:glycosyltransferase involved in cell wall biosynthesis
MDRIVIISAGPIGTTGASLIHFDTLLKWHDFFNCKIEFVALSDCTKLNEKYSMINFNHSTLLAENSQVVNQSVPLAIAQEKIIELAASYHEKEYSIVLFGTYLFPYAYVVNQANIILKKMGILSKLLIQPCGSDIWKFGQSLKNIYREVLTNADVVLCYSEKFAHEIGSLVGFSTNFAIVPPIINSNRFSKLKALNKRNLRSQLSLPNNAQILISVSNMRYIKGIINVFEISKSWAEKTTNLVILILVGPLTTDLEDLLIAFKSTSTTTDDFMEYRSGKLFMRHYGARDDVQMFLQVSDIFINASYHDSFNTSICEALACGLPVISSLVVGMMAFSSNNPIGCFFEYPKINYSQLINKDQIKLPISQSKKIIEFMEFILSNKKLYNSISINARKFVVRNFSWIKLEPVYKFLLEKF